MSRSPAVRDASPPHLSSDRVIQPGDLVFADIVTLLTDITPAITEPFAAVPQPPSKEIVSAWLMRCCEGNEKLEPAYHRRCLRSVVLHPIGGFSLIPGFGLAFGHGVGVGLWERPIIHRLYSLDYPWN